ncbi:MAG TPA: hypothetical protein VFJ74_09850 [Gemmatimonadaceae bacterium]|nr:hypothetical protein [Gemmatimonadaceae bacterium]
MSAAERTYRMLLRAYPARFRAAYGREMVLVFRDRQREAGAAGARFWSEMIWDVARSAPALRLDEWRARRGRDIQTGEGRMKTMAILAVLIGAIEAANAASEAWLGGIGNGDPRSLAAGAMAAAAGAVLLASGVAMLRRSARAVALARAAAVACLALFALIGAVAPRMSMFSMLLGVAFPVALLIFLSRTRGRGSSVPTTA